MTLRSPSRVIPLIAYAIAIATPAAELGAQTRRALIVGINHYEAAAPARVTASALPAASTRAKITDLGGAVNDAQAMRDLLQARFAFSAENVTLLTDQQATRAGILSAIDGLLTRSSRGDVVVFYYAGHGSQRVNSLSPEPSKLDQTLVPADANAGVEDIRDKEIARAFNRFIDKGVELVLIFDSCHSGSVARGGIEQQGGKRRERWAAIDPRDVKDPGVEETPADRGALVLSAAQDYQLATEMEGPSGRPNGIFTNALVTTLLNAAPGEAALDVFRSVKARMQSDGHLQEPVIEGPAARQQRPVFGGLAGSRAGRTSVAVLRVQPDGLVTLQGGPALGIRDSAVLRKVGVPADTGIRVRIDTVVGISETRGRVIAGDAARVAVGDRFELERWMPAPNAGLALAVPAALSATTLRSMAGEIGKLRGAPGIEWIDDPSTAPADSTPNYVMQWTGNAWTLRARTGDVVALPPNPTAAQVRAAISQREKDRPVRFVLSLPPTPEIAAALGAEFNSLHAVRLTRDGASANYVLVGRAGAAALEYSLMRVTASSQTTGQSTMPSRSEWVSASGTSADTVAGAQLVQHAATLAKIRSWLLLEAPPNEGVFPYQLAFRRVPDGKLVREGHFTGGERYEIVLVADSSQITPYLERRRVYVFGIDSHGNGALLYPQSNVENRFPMALGPDNTWPTEIPLGPRSRFRVGPPYGTDTYVLLTSDEVVDPAAFQWHGVRAGVGGGLAGLLSSATAGTRAASSDTPLNWSIERVPIVSQPQR